MTFYHFDETRWPIIVLTINGSPKNDKDMKSFLLTWQNLYVTSMQNEERYKLIFDARNASIIKLKYLQAMGEWLSKIKHLTETWMDRTAIIVSNDSIQLLIQFVFQIYKAVRPFKVFNGKHVEKAFKWVVSDEEGDATDTGKVSLGDLKLTSQIDFSA